MSLVLDGLSKRFGRVLALDGLSFEAPRGQIFGFLGANGAGKTTAMRIILGVLRADSGTISWNGVVHDGLPRRTWGYLPEERGLYPRMTILDQLVYFAGLYGVPRDQAAREGRAWLARFRVPDFADRRADELSKGNQQKVQFLAAAIGHGARVTHFEIADPSLEQIFIDHVGRPPDEDLTLASADAEDPAA